MKKEALEVEVLSEGRDKIRRLHSSMMGMRKLMDEAYRFDEEELGRIKRNIDTINRYIERNKKPERLESGIVHMIDNRK